ncbi:MAG: acylneuraminate cytidylyltransferase family protein [Rhodospirillales bacterium]|nr:acylneuraminate cytidylyltransferase family protein [Rhodospirillales bacterium]
MSRNKTRSIVVIPARGASKRFPRKNVAILAGKPLVTYAIGAAKKAATIDGNYVSTDDIEIADIARAAGAQVPYLRPEELAGDQVTADDVVNHLIRHLRTVEEEPADIVVLIQPTSPFVKAAHIDAAVNMLKDCPDLDSVTTMSPVDHRHHPYNLSFMSESGRWEFCFADERENARSRQAKPPAQTFCNLFAARTETFLSHGRFGRTKGCVVVDPLYAWDIDYEWELVLAETLIERGYVDLEP